jgi:hypothetical protein
LPQLIDKGGTVAKDILIEEFHVSVFIPGKLSGAETSAIRRTFDSARFQTRVERVIRRLIRQYRSLRKVKIALTR